MLLEVKSHLLLLYMDLTPSMLPRLLSMLSQTRETRSKTSGFFQDGALLIIGSQALSTFQYGGRDKFHTLGTVVDVKVPTCALRILTDSHGLPGPTHLIPEQTIDRSITGRHTDFRSDVIKFARGFGVTER